MVAVCAKEAIIDAWEDSVRCTKRGAPGEDYKNTAPFPISQMHFQKQEADYN